MKTNTSTPTNPSELLRSLDLGNRVTVTVSEFSKLNGRARGWAYRRIAAGELRVIQNGGNILVPVAEVLRYATGGK